MRLVHDATHLDVAEGDEVTDFRGDKAVVTGWDKPRHAGSTGRIYVRGYDHDYIQGYYPGVFDCTWVEREDRQDG